MPRYGSVPKRRKLMRRSVRKAASRYHQKRVWSGRRTTVSGFNSTRVPARTWFGSVGRVDKLCPDYGIDFIALRHKTAHKYSNGAGLSGDVGGIIGATARIYLNDIAHPDAIPGGTQFAPSHDPYGTTELRTIYNQYMVVAATVEVEVLNALHVANDMCVVPYNSKDSFTISGLATNICREMPGGQTVSGQQVSSGAAGTVTTTAGAVPKLVKTFWIHEMEGLTFKEFMSMKDDYSAAAGASPALRPNLEIGVGDYAGNNNSGMSLRWVVTYHVIWYERKVNSGS